MRHGFKFSKRGVDTDTEVGGAQATQTYRPDNLPVLSNEEYPNLSPNN